jgi:hypothetical protein
MYAGMRHTNYYLASVKQLFAKIQFEYLIKKMQMCHFTDEQWKNLKVILIDHWEGFTDDQWNTVFHLLSVNRLNDEQFGIFVDMLDSSTLKLILLHAGGGPGNTFVTCKIFEELALCDEICHCACPTGVGLCTYLKAKLSTVFSGH